MVVLKRLGRRRARRRPGLRGDPRHRGGQRRPRGEPDATRPAPARCWRVRRAWAAAGLDPAARTRSGCWRRTAPATPAGDAAELATLRRGVRAAPGRPAPVIGSVKSMIGHTMPAAGVAGLIKAALAVHHGVLPPDAALRQPRIRRWPAPGSADRTRARPWTGDGPRRAGGQRVRLRRDQRPRRPGGSRRTPRAHRAALVLRGTGSGAAAGRRLPAGAARHSWTPAAERRPTAGAGSPWSSRHRRSWPPPAGRSRPRSAVAGPQRHLVQPPPAAARGGQLAFVFPGLEAEFARRSTTWPPSSGCRCPT